MTESQKRQFRLNVEELKAKLHDTMANRDSLLELRFVAVKYLVVDIKCPMYDLLTLGLSQWFR